MLKVILFVVIFFSSVIACSAGEPPVKHSHDDQVHSHPVPSSDKDHFHKRDVLITPPFNDVSCGKWEESEDEYRQFWYVWFTGWVSGLNVIFEKSIQTVSFSTFKLYTNKYCRGDPLETIPNAVNSLVKKLMAQ